MIRVVALGELLIDFAEAGTNESGFPLMQANPGGAPCNYLAALQKNGIQTAFIGMVGEDDLGTLLERTLQEQGIDTRGLKKTKEAFTTLAFVQLNENGERSFSFSRKPGADTLLTFDETHRKLIEEAEVFHFGTLSLTQEPAKAATEEAVFYAKEKGKMISFDPNLRLPLWGDEEDAKAAMLWGLRGADVVKISKEEVLFLFDETIEKAAEQILEEYDVKLLFITCGAEGSYYKTKKASGFADAIKVKAVDTTGAGDIFFGTAMSKLVKSGKQPEELTTEELTEILIYASAAAGLSTERVGGMSSIPEPEDVEEIIRTA